MFIGYILLGLRGRIAFLRFIKSGCVLFVASVRHVHRRNKQFRVERRRPRSRFGQPDFRQPHGVQAWPVKTDFLPRRLFPKIPSRPFEKKSSIGLRQGFPAFQFSPNCAPMEIPHGVRRELVPRVHNRNRPSLLFQPWFFSFAHILRAMPVTQVSVIRPASWISRTDMPAVMAHFRRAPL